MTETNENPGQMRSPEPTDAEKKAGNEVIQKINEAAKDEDAFQTDKGRVQALDEGSPVELGPEDPNA